MALSKCEKVAFNVNRMEICDVVVKSQQMSNRRKVAMLKNHANPNRDLIDVLHKKASSDNEVCTLKKVCKFFIPLHGLVGGMRNMLRLLKLLYRLFVM